MPETSLIKRVIHPSRPRARRPASCGTPPITTAAITPPPIRIGRGRTAIASSVPNESTAAIGSAVPTGPGRESDG